MHRTFNLLVNLIISQTLWGICFLLKLQITFVTKAILTEAIQYQPRPAHDWGRTSAASGAGAVNTRPDMQAMFDDVALYQETGEALLHCKNLIQDHIRDTWIWFLNLKLRHLFIDVFIYKYVTSSSIALCFDKHPLHVCAKPGAGPAQPQGKVRVWGDY